MTTQDILNRLANREITAEQATTMMLEERDRQMEEMRPRWVPRFLWKWLLDGVTGPHERF